MSRIIASAIISLIIVILCIAERAGVNAIIDESKNYIKQMETEYKEDDSQAKETAKKLNEYWESKEKLLCLFYADSELDNISVDVATMPYLSKKDDEFLHYCNTILKRLDLLNDHSKRVFG